MLTRIGWVQAGHVSARDWRLPLEIAPEGKQQLSLPPIASTAPPLAKASD